VDPVVPIEESVGAMAEMVKEGKARYIGISKELTADHLNRAWSVHPIVSVQDEYSLFVRDPESQLLSACHDHDMAFMAFAPLGRGILAGLFGSQADIPEGDSRRKDDRYKPGNFEQNLKLVNALAAMAKEKSVSTSALVLAWLMHQKRMVIPIPSSKSRKHLAENAAAAALRLSSEDLQHIAEICPPGSVAGHSNHAVAR
jgi:aryl-alcohol dehydrogenase-like predicted oxidoreductase